VLGGLASRSALELVREELVARRREREAVGTTRWGVLVAAAGVLWIGLDSLTTHTVVVLNWSRGAVEGGVCVAWAEIRAVRLVTGDQG